MMVATAVATTTPAVILLPPPPPIGTTQLTTLHGNVHTNNSTNFHAVASTMGERDNGNCGAGMCPVDHETQSLWGLLGGSASGNDHRKRFRTNGSINSNANVHVHAVVSTGVR
mmetsp:Transcript_1777/g.3562  ORF Transcript_1777/g.3562 Transcript_1777/m.3562 type:complete len:113 (+) Transcript_1777:1240-1578(+)